MTEKEMREAEVPRVDDIKTLTKYIGKLVGQKHDYGTCVYAMSMAASRGVGMPIINPHRKAEKLRMDVLGLKSRKQLRKARKKETKRKAAAVFN